VFLSHSCSSSTKNVQHVLNICRLECIIGKYHVCLKRNIFLQLNFACQKTFHHFENVRQILVSKSGSSWALVAHTSNSSYSGDRDQENHGLKPAWAVWETQSQKYLTQKRAGGVAQSVGPELKSQYRKKKKKKKKKKGAKNNLMGCNICCQ
jgi:hypothetical protein